jgi:hypothetical protein
MSDLLATARLIYSPPLLEAMDRVSYVGIITAIAPGRFAAAINQPPVLSYSAILPVDWLTVRAGVALAGAAAGASAAPSLRSVRDLRGSKRVLSETPLCDRQDPYESTGG